VRVCFSLCKVLFVGVYFSMGYFFVSLFLSEDVFLVRLSSIYSAAFASDMFGQVPYYVDALFLKMFF